MTLRDNEIWSTGSSFVDPRLKYIGEGNRYVVSSGDGRDLVEARNRLTNLHEKDSTVTAATAGVSRIFGKLPEAGVWQLVVTAPVLRSQDSEEMLRGTLVEMKSAMAQFGHAGLQAVLAGDSGAIKLAQDWSLAEDGIRLEGAKTSCGFSVRLISPRGKAVREWKGYPGATDLGLELRQRLGAPDFSNLPFENVPATD